MTYHNCTPFSITQPELNPSMLCFLEIPGSHARWRLTMAGTLHLYHNGALIAKHCREQQPQPTVSGQVTATV